MLVKIETGSGVVEVDLSESEAKKVQAMAMKLSEKKVAKEKRIASLAPQELQRNRGFLWVKCCHCGEARGFYSKYPMQFYKCHACQEVTELGVLKPAHPMCECGTVLFYKTNINDATFEVRCIDCGSYIDQKYNKRRHRYENLA